MELSEKMIIVRRVVTVLLSATLVAAIAWQAGWAMAKTAVRQEAVRAGHARHIIVDDLGHTQFEWLEKNDIAPAAKPPVK